MLDNELLDEPVSYHSYAIGDIHGEVSLLRRLLDLLPYRPEDHLIFLGDYVDRGEDSIAVIRTLQAIQQAHPHCFFLRGNHEDAWLEQWDGTKFLDQPLMPGARKVWESCNGQIPADIGEWLSQTRIDYEDANAYYVHAGVLPDKPFYSTPPYSKMWGARGFADKDYDWGKTVVFGHWEQSSPMIKVHKIGLDTGAWRTGNLTAIQLPARRIFQVHRELEA
ncbi:serine/threonine protein phosphatase [Dictyobacter alpinus]|uniref:Serine/threonine protein phosphatase n=1 Tax=Dictyobacter alpinus TaxID=2014873 RepID=A0A402BJT0_9CHLR|nr:metallophosphoesterase [Dictyobacter alpinus]GCE31595.1 serine/threonine protein phosphatase [Dictyobacter alpinus]